MNHSNRKTRCERRVYHFCCCAVLLLLMSVPSTSQANKRVTDLTLEGLNLAYNFELDKAESKFNEAIQVEPSHPRPFVGKATVLFWRFALGNDDKLYEELLSHADRAIEVAEEYIDNNEKDSDALTCLGSLYGYKAFAHARQRSYFKAAWDGKKSLDYFSDAVEANPKAYDAYLGLGCYHYFASFAPKSLQWVISILGADGNPDLGVRELKLAVQKGTYTSIEAQYYLAQFLPWQSGNFNVSESLLVDLNKRFPKNALVAFTLAVWEMRRNAVGSAQPRLQEIVQADRGFVPGLKAISLYKLAECNFRKHKFQDAIKEYDAFLSVFDDEHYRATAHFRIGISYEMLGQRAQAVKHYQAARAEERRHGDDRYSARKAEILIKAPMSGVDSLLMCAKNAFKTGAYNTAKELYKKLDSLQSISPSLRAEARFGIGEILIEQEAFAEALPYFNSVLTINVGEEFWLIPWSHYQLGFCHSKLGNSTVARHEFEAVQDYDENYDFKNWLGFRTERELERLK
ncbi:MAG: DUF3808 domain-containing protein [Bacteroidetes bacterium]|nr:MAG: DUF3808 domain-containing protein [Bacteroidota bacterium]